MRFLIIFIIITILTIMGSIDAYNYFEKSKEILRDKRTTKIIEEQTPNTNFNIIKPVNSNQL